jgi:hypothetical protein
MLRRLPENHKTNAVRLLFGETKYNPLHDLPHGDSLVCEVCFKVCKRCLKRHTHLLYLFSIPLGGETNMANQHRYRELQSDEVSLF